MNVTVLVLYKDGVAETKHYNRVGLMTKYHILSNKLNNCRLLMWKPSLRYSCTVRCHLRIYYLLQLQWLHLLKGHTSPVELHPGLLGLLFWSRWQAISATSARDFLCSTHKHVRKGSLSLILRYFLFKLQFNCQYLVMMPHSVRPTGKRKIWCLSFQNSWESTRNSWLMECKRQGLTRLYWSSLWSA